MGASEGNTNAKKKRTRVSVCLSIADEKGRLRLDWAIRQVQQHWKISDPTDEDVRLFLKSWLYGTIDGAMNEKGFAE